MDAHFFALFVMNKIVRYQLVTSVPLWCMFLICVYARFDSFLLDPLLARVQYCQFAMENI